MGERLVQSCCWKGIPINAKLGPQRCSLRTTPCAGKAAGFGNCHGLKLKSRLILTPPANSATDPNRPTNAEVHGLFVVATIPYNNIRPIRRHARVVGLYAGLARADYVPRRPTAATALYWSTVLPVSAAATAVMRSVAAQNVKPVIRPQFQERPLRMAPRIVRVSRAVARGKVGCHLTLIRHLQWCDAQHDRQPLPLLFLQQAATIIQMHDASCIS